MKNYTLDKNVYHETVWFIRQYPDLKKRYTDCVRYVSGNLAIPGSKNISDPVFNTVNRMLPLKEKIDYIEKGLSHVPEEYRKGILENIIYKKPYPITADTSTWKRWKRRLVWFVAYERDPYLLT